MLVYIDLRCILKKERNSKHDSDREHYHVKDW